MGSKFDEVYQKVKGETVGKKNIKENTKTKDNKKRIDEGMLAKDLEKGEEAMGAVQEEIKKVFNEWDVRSVVVDPISDDNLLVFTKTSTSPEPLSSDAFTPDVLSELATEAEKLNKRLKENQGNDRIAVVGELFSEGIIWKIRDED